MSRRALCPVFLTVPLLAAACRAPEAVPSAKDPRVAQSVPARRSEAGREAAADAPAQARLAPEGLASVASNMGTFRVHHKSDPAVIERGKPFRLQAWITREGSRELVPWASLSVDADMPEHLHGMNRVPKVARQADGSFLVEGMLFHMPGRWDLHFDVHEAAIVERAQVAMELP
ncbi:MAG: hypothetical protein RIR65_2407 [Planctomycetota bacterium]|jgi:hypothetical protein